VKRSVFTIVLAVMAIGGSVFVLATRHPVAGPHGAQGSVGALGKEGLQGAPGPQGLKGRPAIVMTAARLEVEIETDSDVGDSDYQPTNASCVEKTVNAAGVGTYQCLIDYKYTGTDSYYPASLSHVAKDVIVDKSGMWQTVGS
jgi:hypothetical protein